MLLHAKNASYKNKTLLHRHFDPAFMLYDLNVYYGGREICRAVVQQLSIGTKARQISPSRKSRLTIEVVLAQLK